MGIFKKREAPTLSNAVQDKLLAEKKAELGKTQDDILQVIAETKKLTMEIIEHLKKETTKVKLALKSTLSEHYDKGIAFISHRGDILFVNKLAVDIFEVPQSKLVGSLIDHVLIEGKKPTHLNISEHSKKLIEKITECSGDESCLQIVFAGLHFSKRSSNGCTFVLSNKEVIGPLKIDVTLLDIEPKSLADITYIVYIEPTSKKEAVVK